MRCVKPILGHVRTAARRSEAEPPGNRTATPRRAAGPLSYIPFPPMSIFSVKLGKPMMSIFIRDGMSFRYGTPGGAVCEMVSCWWVKCVGGCWCGYTETVRDLMLAGF